MQDRSRENAEREFQEELILSHAALARSLARRFAGRGQSIDDMEQVALLALVKAARRYQPGRSSTFATFAIVTITGEIKRHFRDKTWMVRPPRSVQEHYLAVRAARDELSQLNHESPSLGQIAAHVGLREEEVIAAMEAAEDLRPLSLDVPAGEDQPAIQIAVEDDAFELNLSLRELRENLARLAPSEQTLIRRIFFDGWSQRQFAERIGVSQMQVSRMLTGTLSRLRRAMAPA